MVRTILILMVWFSVLNCDLMLAQKPEQDGPVGIFPSVAGYRQFMGAAKQLAYGEDGSPELQAMIPMINDMVLNRPIGSTATQYNTQASMLGMLDDEHVRADLEMVDDQYNRLRDMSAQIQKRAAEQFRDLDFSNREGLVDNIMTIRQQTEDELIALLLPHQIQRLKQIRMQALLRRQSLVDLLSSDPLKTDLKITNDQAEDLKAEERKIRAEMARKIQQLEKEAREKLLQRLKPSQQADVKELIGDTFDFVPSDQRQKNKNEEWAKQRESRKKKQSKGRGR